MITIDGINYVNGTRIPMSDVKDVVQEAIKTYLKLKGVISNDNAIKNIIKDLGLDE